MGFKRLGGSRSPRADRQPCYLSFGQEVLWQGAAPFSGLVTAIVVTRDAKLSRDLDAHLTYCTYILLSYYYKKLTPLASHGTLTDSTHRFRRPTAPT